MRLLQVLLSICGLALCPAARAWGNEGHQVVALIAQQHLTTKTLAAVLALLAQDTDKLTAHTIAAEATWADAYRASSGAAFAATHNWHFADIEIPGGSLQAACYGFPVLPAGTPASQGPAKDCHVDKIDEAVAELKATSNATVAEKLLALKYLLHFVGDLHQPLHTADQRDAGGNAKVVKAPASKLGTGKLHAFWDTSFVAAYGANAAAVAAKLEATIGKAQFAAWYVGDAKAWADEAHAYAVSTAYGGLPSPDASGAYVLSPAYVSSAEAVVGTQLARAGVRLAYLLNQCFDPKGKVPKVTKPAARSAPTHTHVPTAAFVADDLRYHGADGDR